MVATYNFGLVYTCDIENADDVLNGGKPHTSVVD